MSGIHPMFEYAVRQHGGRLFKVIQLGALTFGWAFVFADRVAEVRPSSGPSMLPTLAVQGDYLLTEKTCLWRRFSPLPPLRRGDLVVYTSPVNPKLDVCKRVLGLAGDVVCIDPSGLSGEEARYERVRVPKGHLWVQGDNLDSSNDSRLYGPVPLGLVKGRVVARVLPFSRRTLFDPSSAFRLSS